MELHERTGRISLERLPSIIYRTGMGRSWLYREIQAGRFPKPFRIGGTSCWDSRQIDAWIEARCAEAGAR